MSHPDPHRHDSAQGDGVRTDAGRSRSRWGFLALALVAAGYLIAQHGAHLATVLPILVILACPLMHLFGHGGHGSHRARGADEERGDTPPR